MQLNTSPHLEIVDYCIVVLVLVLSVLIGLYTSFKRIKSADEFLMGNRSFSAVPISISLLTSFVAADSLLGYSGEAYANGIQMSLFLVGGSFGILFAGFLFLPVLYPLKLTSVHEYIELRFHSPRLRSCVSFFVCLQIFFYMGFCLASPAIALEAVTPFSSWTCILILGAVCTFYSTIGGIRAIVWTDVLQMAFIMAGLIVIVVAGTIQIGGLREAWSIATAGERLNIFNMDLSTYDRPNFYNTIAYGFCGYFNIYGITQINFQRMCSVPTIKDARKVLVLNIFGLLIIYFFIFSGGLIAYSAYAGCDPLLLGKIKKKEEILSYFVTDRLNFITGLPGLFLATITAGTLSTLSSTISAQVAIIWKDISPKIKMLTTASPGVAALINKFLSLLIGVGMTGSAMIVSEAGSIIRYSTTVMNMANGAVFGIYFLGVLFPKCNLIGVWCGAITSVGFLSWIAIGSTLYVESQTPLPFSTDSCNLTMMNNFTMMNNLTSRLSGFQHFNTTVQSSTVNELDVENIVEATYNSFSLKKLYSTSFTLYPLLGQATCIIVGIIVSTLTGSQKQENTSPKYVSPYIRKFYWKETKVDSLKNPI